MPVSSFDHVNIRTEDPVASAQFYVDIFDLEYRHQLIMGNDAHWLYDEAGRAIIHFRRVDAESSSTGSIDHVALNCRDKTTILDRLGTRNIPFTAIDLQPSGALVLLKDPHGVALELRFLEE